MANIISGKRYAQAAFELALERNELDSWQESLKKIADLSGDKKLMALLENPKFPFATKKGLLQERLGEINLLALNLVFLLVTKGKLGIASNISQQYDVLLDAYRGIEHAEVVTALPLSNEDTEVISRRLGEIVRHEVVIDAQVDPSIIGGFRARIGDMLIDGSVQHRLETLKKNLT
ncbi:MAG: ATP synthase F1 subunit delta [Chloroflexota bacterium]|nr:ATP synthase F1 subunit delta [Chloroflexota bacterium]